MIVTANRTESSLVHEKKNKKRKSCTKKIKLKKEDEEVKDKIKNDKLKLFSLLFLVADTRLYTLPCRSIRPSVRPSLF